MTVDEYTGYIGDGALAGNLMKVFDVEGSENLLSGSFSADAAEVDAVMSKDGNVKFKVKPKANGGKMPDRFFFRVKMK